MTIIEKLRSHIDDLLFQWDQKEKEYVATICRLESDRDELDGLVASLRRELELVKEHLRDSRYKEDQLILELHNLRTKKNRWNLFL